MKRNSAKNKLFCDCCNRLLLRESTNQNRALLAAKVLIIGGVAKNTILLNAENRWYYYCDNACKKIHFDEVLQIDETHNEAYVDQINEIRRRMPEVAKQMSKNVESFRQALLKMKKR